MRHLIFVFFLTLAAVLSSELARAGTLDITVEQVKVYASPDVSSEVITTLFKGDSVPVSNKSTNGFQKVLVKDGRSKKIGYIRDGDLVARVAARPGVRGAAQPRPVIRGASRPVRSLGGRGAFGLLVGMDYQTQGARTYTSVDPTQPGTSNIGTLSGIATVFGAYGDFGLSRSMNLEVYAMLKSISVGGTASYPSTTGTPGAPTDIFLSENFFSGGGLLKFYNGGGFWWGPGIEINKGLSGNLKFGSNGAVALDAASLGMYFYGYGAAGYDIRLSNKFYLTPRVHVGALFATPLIIEVDAMMGLSYAM